MGGGGFQRGSCKGLRQQAHKDRQVQVESGAKRVEEGGETARGYTWEETTSV